MDGSHRGLLERIDTLVERGRKIRLQLLDDTALEWVDPELVSRVFSILGETVGLLEEVERAAEAGEKDGGGGSTVSPVRDVAALGRGEVVSHLEAVRGSRSRNLAWQIISEADRGLDRAERALIAVEDVLREEAGRPPLERTHLRLEESLAVRRLYVAFRRTFLLAGSPTGEALSDELWAVRSQIDAIRSLRDYGVIRIEDRRQLQELRRRITLALDHEGLDGEGERRAVWSDAESFSRLLMTVHRREDLREHDRALVSELGRALDAASAGGGTEGRRGSIEERMLTRLAPLLGRDSELDRVLVTGDRPERETLRRLLERLETELAGHGW